MASTIEKVTETPASRRDFIRRLAIGFGGSVLLGGGTCRKTLGGSPPVAPGSLLVANDENGEEVSGLPLIWQADTGLLLDRFGALKEVDPRRCSQIRSAGSYEPANHAETRSHLMNELGRSYDVRAAGSMVIAQPRGGGGQWAQAIESLYRNFQREFTVRGIPLRNGRFPLISIVCPNQNEFMRQVVRAGHTPSGNMLGVYSALNNRMMLYDHGMSAGGVNSTIQHEAAHQYAFNLGLHIRLADNPQWFVEGLGAMFEAAGMAKTGGSDLSARTDTYWKGVFLREFKDGDAVAAEMPGLVERDATFNQNTDRGYGLSWALTTYLLNRMPQAYAAIAANVASLQPLVSYPAAKRRRDFERAVGSGSNVLAMNLHRWISDN